MKQKPRKKVSAVKLLTRPKGAACCCEAQPAPREAQCCAKASPLVAGCHD